MKKDSFQCALDLSGSQAVLAAGDGDGRFLKQFCAPMQRREASHLADWVLDSLASLNIELSMVHRWTIGAGPGSFTGMRLAAALAEGWCFGRSEVKRRSVPTALALAEAGMIRNGERFGILFDGRNHELLLFEVTKMDGVPQGTGRTAILNQAQAVDFFRENHYDKLLAQRADAIALEKLLSQETAKKLVYLDQLEAKYLLLESLGAFDDDLTQLVYIRPSVAGTTEVR